MRCACKPFKPHSKGAHTCSFLLRSLSRTLQTIQTFATRTRIHTHQSSMPTIWARWPLVLLPTLRVRAACPPQVSRGFLFFPHVRSVSARNDTPRMWFPNPNNVCLRLAGGPGMGKSMRAKRLQAILCKGWVANSGSASAKVSHGA